MSTISGFVQYRSAHVVCGSVPAQISLAHETWAGSLDARDAWYGTRMEVEYPSPTQLWLMMEMTDAGRDLDSMLCDARKEQTTFPMHEVFDIFWGIAEAMMRGEGLAEFEHRDLHAGNICLKRRDSAVDVSAEEGVARKSIYEVTLIDYTQSRLRLETGEVLATAIDESIFRQMDDDADAQRQYDVYRCMRDVVKRERKAGVTVGQMWREYVPVTNVLWLQHTLEELLAVTRASETKEELDMILALAKLKSKLSEGRESKRWRYRSAREVVCGFLVDQQAG